MQHHHNLVKSHTRHTWSLLINQNKNMHTRREKLEGKDMSHFFFESGVNVEVSWPIVQLGRCISG